MISDEVFIDELDASLKTQGLGKAARLRAITISLTMPASTRDVILDVEASMAKQVIKAKQDKKAVRSETAEQIDFIEWFKKTYKGVVIIMIRNDGSRTFAERPEQLLMGLHAGATDLYVPAWHCWIEFKRTKGGVLSEAQIKFRDYVLGIGDKWLICNGFEDGKAKVIKLNKNI